MHSDVIQRFYFSGQPVRGAIVKLQNSYIESLNGRDYPPIVNALLGECLASTLLMGVHLKHQARLSLQARGNGIIHLLMGEAQLKINPGGELNQHSIRAVARLNDLYDASAEASLTLDELIGQGHLAITIEPEEGERYQGIVEAKAASLSACLENYFQQSEQLPTTMQLITSPTMAAGLLIQRMPAEEDKNLASMAQADNLWEELNTLVATVSHNELLALDSETLLYRLFHEHAVTLSPAEKVCFDCSCSEQRTGQALLKIGVKEVSALLKLDNEVVMDCEFCSARYRFTQSKLQQLGMKFN